MIDIRAGILTVAICLIIFAIANQPHAVKVVETPYCVVDKRVAGKDADGEYHFGWGKMYSPCNQQDIFRDI